jgi:hypothetical protein
VDQYAVGDLRQHGRPPGRGGIRALAGAVGHQTTDPHDG